MSGALLAFAVAAGLVSAVFIGLAPAVQAASAARGGTLRPALRAVTARGSRVRRLLIASEVAVVVLLLTGALLFLRTFVSLRGVDLGFRPAQVWSVSTRWPIGHMAPSTPGTRPWPRIQRAVDGLVAAVAGIPGVEAVGLITDVPLTGTAVQRDRVALGCAGRRRSHAADGSTRSLARRSQHRHAGLFHGARRSGREGPQLRRQRSVHRRSAQWLDGPGSGSVIVNARVRLALFPGPGPGGRSG